MVAKAYKIGDIVHGVVTGIQSYGVFVSMDEETQGLIHISECKHGYMDNLKGFIKVGQPVTAKVIDIDEYTKKISLSMRALEALSTPKEPTRRKKVWKKHPPDIGFASLEQQLPEWIAHAKETFVLKKDIDTK